MTTRQPAHSPHALPFSHGPKDHNAIILRYSIDTHLKSNVYNILSRETILTSALIVDTRFITWTCVIIATSNIAQAIVAYLIRDAVVIAIANRLTNATVASFVAQAIRITVKINNYLVSKYHDNFMQFVYSHVFSPSTRGIA